jgi:lysophospholipase L1-like esterase
MSSRSNRSWQHAAIRIIFSLAIFHILIPSSSAASFAGPQVPRAAVTSSTTPAQSNLTTASNTTIAFSSAVSLASSVSNQLAQLTSIPAIPLPSTISNYKTWTQLASMMPPLQTNTVDHDTAEMLAAVRNSLKGTSNNGTTAGGLAGRQAAIRVMIVGDSMSQGQQGDWTWRYRIWEWFNNQGIAVNFVGPYTGTVQPDPPSAPSPPPLYGTSQPTGPIKTSGGYAAGVSPDFNSNSNHFAVWGRAAAVDKGLIQDVVTAHQADLMLLMLGFNDMGWFYSDAPGTLDSIITLINNARAANPNLKFAIANVPQRTFIGGRNDLPLNTDIYNGLLNNVIPGWSTTQSPVHLVHLQENYDCETTGCPAGYDGLHPNALGEYQIARAFTLTLVNDFQIGTSPLAIPSDIPARPLPVPFNFQLSSSSGGATATWDAGRFYITRLAPSADST